MSFGKKIDILIMGSKGQTLMWVLARFGALANQNKCKYCSEPIRTRNKNLQKVRSAGKHVAGGKRGKTALTVGHDWVFLCS